MTGFYLLMGHLLGDYILQNDWMAANKTNPHPGPEPYPGKVWLIAGQEVTIDRLPVTENPAGPPPDVAEQQQWLKARKAWHLGNLTCAIHCLLYTMAVWACSWWWLPLWGLAVCFAAHYPMDRYRLARKWMSLVGQEKFATGPLAPWSIIIVDNVIHLLTLAAIAALAGAT